MSRYSLTSTSVTPTAFADTTNLSSSNYVALLQGGSSTQQLKISEIFMGGEAASSSSPSIMVLARDSTVGATVSAGATRNALLDSTSTAPGTTAVTGNSATTNPQRSATLHLLHLSFNAYGGLVRWFARPGEEINQIGNAVNAGESSLSAYTGGTPGALSSHILYEVV